MKVTLTIEGAPSALASILANLPGGATASVSPSPQPAPVASSDDDDDTTGDAPAAVGQLDADGLPHDERIHSETPTLTSKGVWRKRRGVSKEEIASVEAQLRANVAAAPVPTPGPAPVAPQMPAAPQPVPVVSQPSPLPTPEMQQPAPVMPPVQSMPVPSSGNSTIPPMPTNPEPAPMQQPAPVAPQPAPAPAPAPQPEQPAAAPTTGQLDFAQFMQHLSGQMAKRDANGQPLVHADYLAQVTNEIATAFGQQLTAITDISANPQMIGFAVQVFQRDNRW